MLHTTSYSCLLQLNSSFDKGEVPKGWTRTSYTSSEPESTVKWNFRLDHKKLNIAVFGRDDIVFKVEADLPLLLFGHSGQLIKSEAELDDALGRLELVLSQIARPYGPGMGYVPGHPEHPAFYYTRVDMPWQFAIDPAFFLLATSRSRHPSIRRDTEIWPSNSVAWPGTKLRIIAYDKAAKMRLPEVGKVLRVEVQVKDYKLSELFDLGGKPLYSLSVKACYAAYERTLMQFPVHPLPPFDGKASIADFLAWVQTQCPDVDVAAVYGQMRCGNERTRRKIIKDVGNRVPAFRSFSWEKYLPVDHLPPPVELHCPRKESLLLEILTAMGIPTELPPPPPPPLDI